MLHAFGDALTSLFYVLGLALLAGGVGAWLLKRYRFPMLDSLEYALFSVGIGLWLLSYFPFLLSMFRILTSSGVKAALTILAISLALRYAVVLFHISRQKVRERERNPPKIQARVESKAPLWAYLIACVGLLFLLSASSSCLTPMVDYDGLAYHVGAPKRWLEQGRMEYLPTHLHTQWPMGVQMHYLLLFPFDGAESAKPLMALYSLLTMGASYGLGKKLASSGVGLVAAGIVVLRAGVPSINTTSIEMPLTLFLTLSAIAIAGWKQTDNYEDKRRWFILAGVMAGFACCIKLNGLLALLFLAAAIFLLATAQGFQIPHRMKSSFTFLALAVVCTLPWYIRSWYYAGNPIYPFVYSLFGGSYWSAEAGRVLTAYFRTFDLPGETIAERHAFVLRHLVKLSALLLAGLLLPGRRWTRGILLGTGIFAMIQVSLSDNPRFLLPATPFAAIIAGWWLMEWDRRLQGSAYAIFRFLHCYPVYGYGLAALLAVLYLPNGFRQIRESAPVILGNSSKSDFINYYVNNREAFEWVNRTLPPDARILYGPDNRTFFLQRTVYWSSEVFQRQVVFDSREAFQESLRRERIGYLILNREVYRDSAISFETRMGWRENERRRLKESSASWEKLFEKNGVEVYRAPAGIYDQISP
jgi:hypothetical protein